MRMRSRILPLLGLLSLAALPASAQSARSERADVAKIRDDRYKWFVGAHGGAIIFGTQSQTQSGIPAGGLHLGIVAKQGGLTLSVEEGFGDNEPTQFLFPKLFFDSLLYVQEEPIPVQFDRLRRYSFNLTGYPVRGSVEPYLGVGFGLVQVINPELTGTFFDAREATDAEAVMNEASSHAFLSFTAGLQFRVGAASVFGQYQIQTAPNQRVGLGSSFERPDLTLINGEVTTNNLLRGTTQTLLGGIRVSLGRARQDITGGGY